MKYSLIKELEDKVKVLEIRERLRESKEKELNKNLKSLLKPVSVSMILIGGVMLGYAIGVPYPAPKLGTLGMGVIGLGIALMITVF